MVIMHILMLSSVSIDSELPYSLISFLSPFKRSYPRKGSLTIVSEMERNESAKILPWDSGFLCSCMCVCVTLKRNEQNNFLVHFNLLYKNTFILNSIVTLL